MDNIAIVNFEEIIDWYNNDELFFLVGAGFSTSSKQNSIGTGKQIAIHLINMIREDLREYNKQDMENAISGILNLPDQQKATEEIVHYVNQVIAKESISLKDASDLLILTKGEHAYKRVIKNYFDERRSLVLDTHKNLIPLIVKRSAIRKKPLVVSLNIDQLIERAYSMYFNGEEIINSFVGGIGNQDFSMLQNSSLWKFHGCVSDLDSLVFNTFSYYKIRHSQEEALNELRQLFRDKHCIMLGVSLQDEHIRDLIFSLYEGHSLPQAVMIAPNEYLNKELINYMNKYMSLAHMELEISMFLELLNKSI